MDSDGWEVAKKTARRPTADRRKLRVILDLQSLEFDASFQPRFLRTDIANAVEAVTSDRFSCSEVAAFAMAENTTKEYQLIVDELKKFCKVVSCYTRKLRCHVCKTLLAQEWKRRLSELEIVKDSGEFALKERNLRSGKTAIFIASNDDFFNVNMAQDLVSQGFDVYTGRVQGMIRKPMFRDRV